jgi:outer membrane protein assembly factor BamB
LYFGTVAIPNAGLVGNYAYALDASTGTVIWANPLPNGGAWYGPTVNANRVIVEMANKEGQSGGIIAFRASDGTTLWTDNLPQGVWSPASFDPTGTHMYQEIGNPCFTQPTPKPGDGCSGSFLDIDPTTGSIRWKYQVPDFSGDDDCATAPAYDNGMIFGGCKNGIEYALNALTGSVVWQFNTGLSGDLGIFSSAAVANGVVYFGAGDKKIHALRETDGTQLWSYTTAGLDFGSPIVANGVIYEDSLAGTLYALHTDGTVLTTVALGGPAVSSPAITNGVLYQTVKTGFADAVSLPAPSLDHLVLSPASSTVGAGTAQPYTATAFDRYGNSLGDVTAATTFSISPDGTCTGAVCTATVAGTHTVTATDGTATGTATLTVNAGPLDHLVVSPGSATISAGGSQTYVAEGFDQYNNDLGDMTAASTFTISPDGTCTGAVCTATVAGAHTVTGTDGTATGTATLTVS